MNAQCTGTAHAVIPPAELSDEKVSNLHYQAAIIGVIVLFLISFW